MMFDYDWNLSDVAKAYKIIYRFLRWQKKIDELSKILLPKGIQFDPNMMNDPFAFMQAMVAVAEEKDLEDIEETLEELEKIGQVSYEELNWAIMVIQSYATMREQVKATIGMVSQSTEVNMMDIEKFAQLIGFKMPTKSRRRYEEEEEEEEEEETDDIVSEDDIEFARRIAQKIKRD